MLTDADGRFTLTDLPHGQGQITVWADKLYQVDTLKTQEFPTPGMVLTMTGTGSIQIKVVDLNGKPASTGNVSVWDQRGEIPGTWGGGAEVKSDGTYVFENVPPGKYFVSADPAARFKKDAAKTPIEVTAGNAVGVELKKP